MNALVFGITGQDGSYLTELLLNKNYKVYGVSRHVSVPTYERISHLQRQGGLELLEGDITDQASVARIIRYVKPDEVYNLAAQSHVGVSFNEPAHTFAVTAGGCLNILEGIRNEHPKAKFYQASSSEMFGNSFSTRYKTDKPLVITNVNGIEMEQFAVEKYQNEETPLSPRSPYAIAKTAAHHFTRLYRISYGIFTCSGMLFNHESERRGENFVSRKITRYLGELIANCTLEFPNKRYLAPEKKAELDNEHEDPYFCHIRKDWKKIIYHRHLLSAYPKLKLGNVKASRDWGHAEDYVRAMWLMMQQDTPDDYVIGTGVTHTVEDFLNLSFGALGLRWEDYVVIDPNLYRPADVTYLKCDYSKAKTKLGWTPEVDFESLVSRMLYNDIGISFGQRLERPIIQEVENGRISTR